jgi:hypothetical protein
MSITYLCVANAQVCCFAWRVGKFAFPSTPTHTRLARDGKGGSNAQGCASRGHFVRLVGLFGFDLLAGMEPPPGASVLKLERWPTTALRKRAARPNLPRMQGLTAHLLSRRDLRFVLLLRPHRLCGRAYPLAGIEDRVHHQA